MNALLTEQLPLFAPRKPRGGKRRHAGRKPKRLRAGSPHAERPVLASRYPVHVVLRVVEAAERADFHIVHLSIQRTHVEDRLVLERDPLPALGRVRRFAVGQPKTWLLREGWKRHGLISYREVPAMKRD